MFNVNLMQQLESESYCSSLDEFHAGNGQSIREILLRQAVKSCDFYATDVVIFLNATIPELMKEENFEADIYFEQSGCHWITSLDGKDEQKNPPARYRYVCKLIKTGYVIKILGAYGNA